MTQKCTLGCSRAYVPTCITSPLRANAPSIVYREPQGDPYEFVAGCSGWAVGEEERCKLTINVLAAVPERVGTRRPLVTRTEAVVRLDRVEHGASRIAFLQADPRLRRMLPGAGRAPLSAPAGPTAEASGSG